MDKRKILIVDFDANAVNSLAGFLTERGFEVLTAADGETGLEKCKTESPDMVIMEPMLPKLHGFELCTIISHDLEPKIPVVILTKFYREEQFKIESLRSFGATAFFSKPYNRNSIIALLEEHLGEKVGETQEQDSQIETEIPSSISLDSLKSLEEQFKKEELELIQDENIEKQLLEAVASLKIELPIPEKKTEITLEIDQMLKDTLSEFGLGQEEEIDTEPQTAQPSVNETSLTSVDVDTPETKLEEPVGPQFERYPAPEHSAPPFTETEKLVTPEEKPEAMLEKFPDETEKPELPPITAEPEKLELSDEPFTAAEPQTEEKFEPVQKAVKAEQEESSEKLETIGSMFGGYSSTDDDTLDEKSSGFMTKLKKRSPQIIIPFAAVILLIITTAFFLLKPKKENSFSNTTANLLQTNPQPAANELRNQTDSIPAQEGVEETGANETEDPGTGSEGEQAPTKTSTETTPPPAKQNANPAAPEQPKPEATRPTLTSSRAAPTEQSIEAGNLPKYLEPSVPVKTTLDTTTETKTNTSEETSDPPSSEKPAEKAEPPKPVENTAKENQPEENITPVQQPQPVLPVAVKTKTGDLVPLKSVDTPPQVLKQELPKYPPIARNKGISGTVIVNALISETGEIIQTVVIRGIKGPFGFNEASEKAVRKWTFKPAEKDGVKVKVWKQIPFTFKESK